MPENEIFNIDSETWDSGNSLKFGDSVSEKFLHKDFGFGSFLIEHTLLSSGYLSFFRVEAKAGNPPLHSRSGKLWYSKSMVQVNSNFYVTRHDLFLLSKFLHSVFIRLPFFFKAYLIFIRSRFYLLLTNLLF